MILKPLPQQRSAARKGIWSSRPLPLSARSRADLSITRVVSMVWHGELTGRACRPLVPFPCSCPLAMQLVAARARTCGWLLWFFAPPTILHELSSVGRTPEVKQLQTCAEGASGPGHMFERTFVLRARAI